MIRHVLFAQMHERCLVEEAWVVVLDGRIGNLPGQHSYRTVGIVDRLVKVLLIGDAFAFLWINLQKNVVDGL